jgi:hypothetical protein
MITNLGGFLVAFLGVGLIYLVWNKQPLSFSLALIILTIGGAVITTIFLSIMAKYGPPHLRNLLLKKIYKNR